MARIVDTPASDLRTQLTLSQNICVQWPAHRWLLLLGYLAAHNGLMEVNFIEDFFENVQTAIGDAERALIESAREMEENGHG